MTPVIAGTLLIATLFVLLASGMPIAFALGLAAIGSLVLAKGPGVMEVLAETAFGGIANLAYVSIPMFVLMGAAIAATPAGRDLYGALDRWLGRVPGGSCFPTSALAPSSPA